MLPVPLGGITNPILERAWSEGPQTSDPFAREAWRRSGVAPPTATETVQAPPLRPISPPGVTPAPLTQPGTQPTTPAASGIASPPPTTGPSAAPALRPISPMHQEVNRIMGSSSGIGAIHSPWARIPLQVLDTIGQVVAPKLEQAIPGTEGHHQALIRGGEGVLNEEEKRATEEAQQEKLGAETENQRAEAIKNAREPQTKVANEGKTVVVDGRVKQLNPATGRYDIDVGEAKSEKEGHEGLEKDAEGNITGWVDVDGKLHSLDDAPPAIKAIAAATKPKTVATKEPQRDDKQIAVYQKEIKAAHPELTDDQAYERAYKQWNEETKVTPGIERAAAFGQNRPVEILTDNGQVRYDTAGHAISTHAPAAANIPAAARGAGIQGRNIIEAGGHLKALIDENKDRIGNLGSYWNQWINGTPIADKDVSRLMAQLGSYAALQPKLHGFRGQDALREFTKIIGGVPKSPEALKAAIDAISDTAGVIAGTGGESSGTQHGGPSVRKYNPATGKLE